jgi:signal transduction histidine kinase
MAGMDGVSTAPLEARRHRALVDALPDLVLRLNGDGVYLEVAGDISKLANPPEVVVGSTVHELLEPDVADGLLRCVRQALAERALATVEYRLRTHLGELRDFEVRVAPAGDDEVVAVVRDVTDVRQATRDLRESRARVVAAGDAASRRIERNLHDGAQQRLVSVALHLSLIRRRLDTSPEVVPALLETAQAELALALEEIRELVRGLHPRVLRDQGLGPAIRTLAERALVPVELAELPAQRLRPAVEAAAYYVAAEALANAAKHGRASHVCIRAALEGEFLVVEVSDDGVGGADPGGSGLRGLADRVAALDGRFAVSSVPGAGTAVRAELPVA